MKPVCFKSPIAAPNRAQKPGKMTIFHNKLLCRKKTNKQTMATAHGADVRIL